METNPSQYCCFSPVTNCLKQDLPDSCTECQPNFYLQSPAVCAPCHSSCLTCDGPNSDDCLTCKDSNKKINGPISGVCLCADPNCFNCAASSPACTVCKPSFFFDPVEAICKICNPSCQTCTGPSASDCLTCNNLNYQLASPTDNSCICKTKDCQECSDPSSPCQRCTVGFTLDTSDQICKTCHSSCKECSALGPNSCTACQIDKTLFTQTSTACSPTSTDSGCCFSCLVSDCLTCQSDGVCHTCKSAFIQ